MLLFVAWGGLAWESGQVDAANVHAELLMEEERGAGGAVLFARSATAGGQRFPVHWGGDCWASFEAMAESLRGGLSVATRMSNRADMSECPGR